MLPTLRTSFRSPFPRNHANRAFIPYRTAAATAQKRAGDISDAFVSLSGRESKPLPQRYAELKARLIKGNEDAVRASWERLLRALRTDVPVIAELGSRAVPEIDFEDIESAPERFRNEYRERGVAVVRSVIPEQDALRYKEDIRAYVRQNPHTRAFPADSPQVFELYWSSSQIRARAHPNLLAAQKFAMSFWHPSRNPEALVSTSHPVSYADRLRIRLPGDTRFALGPHVDGGSVERWEEGGYGLGKVYDAIWTGRWEEFDPWESSCRLSVKSDLYQGVGACSMFRMSQGWLSMSTTGPYEGTLFVNPLLQKATAYYLLRPFFAPKASGPLHAPPLPASLPRSPFGLSAFLDASNWQLTLPTDSTLHGAHPGHGQELSPSLHPHLDLARTMVHVPRVRPGDYVVWHCDTIHAVDRVHGGADDSSVLYIPACPLTEANAGFLVRQREAFLRGVASPDFGGGEGEGNHAGRPGLGYVERVGGVESMRAMGLRGWEEGPGLGEGEKRVVKRANEILGFAN